MRQMKIAVCMIVGNESAHIKRALDSAFSVSDCVVVVRAIGGQKPDETLDIAKARGCIVDEYYNSPATANWNFVDDFAAARNQAFRIGMAQGADWLMWMDCDDVLEEGMGEAIRNACAETAEDWILAEYVLPLHGKAVWRERLFRNGTAAWFYGIHEKCVPVTNDPDKDSLKVRVRRDIKITHDPIGEKSGSQERNLNILRWRYQEAQHLAFYLHYEHYLLGKRDEAVRYGLEAMRMKDLDGVYRYEIMINLALLADKNEHAQDLCKRAIKLSPDRREAYNILALLQMDMNQAREAVATCEKCLTIPTPRIQEWTHRPDCYGWKGEASLAWAHRLASFTLDCDYGPSHPDIQRKRAAHLKKAEGIETAMLERAGSPRISLLHATRGRWSKAIATMNLWISRASNPEAVEHWFAIDQDDVESLAKLRRFRHVVSSPSTYSVGAWNTAAENSTGDILIQIADDFEPPLNWDRLIVDALGDLNKPSVLRVSDGNRSDGLLTIAIVTRAWFAKNGLFHVEYRNVYSDTDLTATATKQNAIIESPQIVVKHQHPFFNKAVQMDATYERGNNPAEYERARAIYQSRHP
jgi:glycosyltransferase involved in cell wall biosynthesis